MSITDKSFYHGAAFAMIAEDEHFTSINKAPNISASGAYILGCDTAIYMKYTTTKTVNDTWKFTFTPEHQSVVRKLFDTYKSKTYILFICEYEGICIVDYGKLATCMDFNFKEAEWIEVYRPDGGSFRIRGIKGEYPNVIPLNAFPRILFA